MMESFPTNQAKAADESTRLAEERTDWAEDRTLLALERTFAGWVRTALAMIGIALGFHALFGKLEPTWLPQVIATMLIVLAIIVTLGAEQRTRRSFAQLRRHTIDLPNLRWIAYAVVSGAAALIVALWTP